MTRLAAPQCPLWRARQRLPRPVAVPARSFASRYAALLEKGARAEPASGLPGRSHPPYKRLHLAGHAQKPAQANTPANDKQLRKYLQLRQSFAELCRPLSPEIQHSDIVPVPSATVIPASVTAATPERFVANITPVDSSAYFLERNLAVFLFTPSFAPWLVDERTFLEKALAQLYKDLPGPSDRPVNVYAICAVVDRLPGARAAGGGSAYDALSADFESRAQQPPVTETGYEGMAYVTLPSRAGLHAQPKMTGDSACLDFLAHTHTDSEGKHYDRLRVPLANTVFQTGTPSTLLSTKWQRSGAHGPFELQSREQVKTAVVNLSAEAPRSTSHTALRSFREAPVLSIPLLPLTMPRQVDGHMGNIVRGILGPNDAYMTASTELEQAVPQFFKARGEPAQATSAWALVIPKDEAHVAVRDTEQLVFNKEDADQQSLGAEDYKLREQQGFDSLWQQQPPTWNTMIQEALKRGARLHKVLSGGGGWGKKAGLLSLDPVPIGAPVSDSPAPVGMADDYDTVDEFSTALKPVVQDGDFIQFFISAVPAQAKDDTAAFKNLKTVEKSGGPHPWSWEFGVIPSTVDDIPGGSWQHTGQASAEMAVFRGSFGALTEGGLTLMRGRTIDSKSGLAAENLTTTMVDVPFSRWSALRLRPKPGVSSSQVGASSKKTLPLLQRAMAMLQDAVDPPAVLSREDTRSNNAGNPS